MHLNPSVKVKVLRMAAADLDTLITSEIPDGRQNLLDSYTNLERVAEYCENNYYQCANKRAALEETKGYTTQSLASVAYQINTLAYNFLQMLDLQSTQLSEMESQVNHISQTVDIHKEKVARREIGILTTNKSTTRQYKIIAPASPERPVKYIRKPIDYSILDDIGHGVRLSQPQQQVHYHHHQQQRQSTSSQYGTGMVGASQYAPGMGGTYGSLGNVSSPSVGPAPTTKPPTPPQAVRYSSGGTLNRSKEYRTPPVVVPPQVPSNYAPNYPQQQQPSQQQQLQQQQLQQQQQQLRKQQYGTLPHAHPQVQMVHPVQQHIHGEHTMPRLSSSSMRSTSSQSSGMEGSQYPLPNSSTPARPSVMNQVQFNLQNTPAAGRQSATPPSQYGTLGGTPSQYGTLGGTNSQYGTLGGNNSQYGTLGGTPSQYGQGATPSQYGPGGTGRPTQRPPSPPLPPPPVGNTPQQQQQQQQAQQQIQQQPIYARQNSDANSAIYSRQMSAASMAAAAAEVANSMYARQASQQHQQQHQQQYQQLQSQLSRQASQTSQQTGLSRQTSHASTIGGASDLSGIPSVPHWVPKNFIERVSAIYDYSADKEDELTFSEGSIIYVLKKNDDGWWEGVMNGVTGLFPGNYVEATL